MLCARPENVINGDLIPALGLSANAPSQLLHLHSIRGFEEPARQRLPTLLVVNGLQCLPSAILPEHRQQKGKAVTAHLGAESSIGAARPGEDHEKSELGPLALPLAAAAASALSKVHVPSDTDHFGLKLLSAFEGKLFTSAPPQLLVQPKAKSFSS